jgi:hypothetical protein
LAESAQVDGDGKEQGRGQPRDLRESSGGQGDECELRDERGAEGLVGGSGMGGIFGGNAGIETGVDDQDSGDGVSGLGGPEPPELGREWGGWRRARRQRRKR